MSIAASLDPNPADRIPLDRETEPAAQRLRNGHWLKPNRQVDERTRIVLRDALQTFTQLEAGQSIPRVALATANSQAFAIGHMIYYIQKMKFFSKSVSSVESLFDDLLHWDALHRPGSIVTRHRALKALKQLGYLDPAKSDFAYKPTATAPQPAEIAAAVLQNSGVSMDDVRSPKRGQKIVPLRFQIIYALRTLTGCSLNGIGLHIGGRDHTTILSALNKVITLREQDHAYRRDVEIKCARADRAAVLRHFKQMQNMARSLEEVRKNIE